MTTEADEQTLVTQEMVDRKAEWGSERTSPPVSESDIRKWAIAVYWPEQPPSMYWDAEYAGGTRHGGIIAPPDFNPFAWPIRPTPTDGIGRDSGGSPPPRTPKPSKARSASTGEQTSRKGKRGMNGGQVETYGVPIRPGDEITTRTRLRDWEERETRLGWTLFTYTETEWRNQNDEIVKLRVSTGIRY